MLIEARLQTTRKREDGSPTAYRSRPEICRPRSTSGRSVSDGTRSAITPGIGAGAWGSMEKTGLPRDTTAKVDIAEDLALGEVFRKWVSRRCIWRVHAGPARQSVDDDFYEVRNANRQRCRRRQNVLSLSRNLERHQPRDGKQLRQNEGATRKIDRPDGDQRRTKQW